MFAEHEVIVGMRKWMKEPTNRFSCGLSGFFSLLRDRNEPCHNKPERLRIAPHFFCRCPSPRLQHITNIFGRRHGPDGQTVRHLTNDAHHFGKNAREIDWNTLAEWLHGWDPAHT